MKLMAMVLVAGAALAGCKDEPRKPAFSAKDFGVAPSPPAAVATPDEPDIEFINGAPKDEGKRAALAVIAACRTRATGQMQTAWGAVDRITVDHHDILDHGKKPMIWDLSYKFRPNTERVVLDGNVLWYQVSDDLSRINPTKDIAGAMCGGLPRDKFSTFGSDEVASPTVQNRDAVVRGIADGLAKAGVVAGVEAAGLQHDTIEFSVAPNKCDVALLRAIRDAVNAPQYMQGIKQVGFTSFACATPNHDGPRIDL